MNRTAKRNQLNNKMNIVQVKTIYKTLHRGKQPDPIIANRKNSIIEMILNKVNSAPSTTSLGKGSSITRKKAKRVVNKMNKIEEQNEDIIELPNPVPNQPNVTFEHIRVPGDGDCFYHAIKKGGLGQKFSTQQIRRTLSRLTTDKEVKKRLLSGGWAENEEIQLTADKYKTCFAIWDASFDTWQIIYNYPKPSKALIATQGCKKIIYLYNHGSRPLSEAETVSRGTHYDLLKII